MALSNRQTADTIANLMILMLNRVKKPKIYFIKTDVLVILKLNCSFTFDCFYK